MMEEKLEHDGKKFKRTNFDKDRPAFWENVETKELLCHCLVDAGFRLWYGDYEINAECVNCKAFNTVYDG